MFRTRLWITVGVIAVTLFLATGLSPLLSFPQQLRMLPGQQYVLNTGMLFTVVEEGCELTESILSTSGKEATLHAQALGEHSLELRIFGFPIRVARITVVPRVEVAAGGQAVGVLLSDSGLLVVRTVSIVGEDGEQHAPAAEAGIVAGDIILRVGSTDLVHPTQMEAETTFYGDRQQKMPVLVQRGKKKVLLHITPVLATDPDNRNPRYMIGVYLRDPVAGVGTLTFWDPKTLRYGALGHMITGEAKEPLAVSNGLIVPAYIHGIQPAVKGRPGEKLGLFEDGGETLGSIEENTHFGIFGTLSQIPEHQLRTESIPVALATEVRTGKAEILTVIEGTAIERFDIEILEVNKRYDNKGLVVRVTDPRLLELTNGIVQGMSGSPILQKQPDGTDKLVGALTHVYVNNPDRGFGVLAEWMVYESGVSTERSNPAA